MRNALKTVTRPITVVIAFLSASPPVAYFICTFFILFLRVLFR